MSEPANKLGDMLTLLLYVLIVGLVAAVLFLLASAVFGRAEELGPLPEGTTATVLPAEDISGADVRALRFQQVVRGYKAGEVDWALTRLAARIDELQLQLAEARGTRTPNVELPKQEPSAPHQQPQAPTGQPNSTTAQPPPTGRPQAPTVPPNGSNAPQTPTVQPPAAPSQPSTAAPNNTTGSRIPTTQPPAAPPQPPTAPPNGMAAQAPIAQPSVVQPQPPIAREALFVPGNTNTQPATAWQVPTGQQMPSTQQHAPFGLDQK